MLESRAPTKAGSQVTWLD